MAPFLMARPLDLVLQPSHRVVALTAGQTITAGRTPQCELQLDDPAVSRRHCTMACTDEGLYVRDLASVSGTFVNERARPGDRIRLGATVIEVRDPSSAAAGPKPGVAALRDSMKFDSRSNGTSSPRASSGWRHPPAPARGTR
jgi:FHA domain